MHANGAEAVWYDWPLILAYHSVSAGRRDGLAITPGDFEYQVGWLRRSGYRSMTLSQFMQEKACGSVRRGDRVALLTFDDGYQDNFSAAFPILCRYGFTGTFFLVSDYLGTDWIYPWDAGKPSTREERDLYRVMSWDEVREMAEYGVELGSHTCTHPYLTTMNDAECLEELSRSRAALEEQLGCEVPSLCYPSGDVDSRVVRLAQQAGYRWATVTPPRPGIPLGRYTLRRVGVYHGTSPWRFRMKITPLFRRSYERPLFRRAFRPLRVIAGKSRPAGGKAG